MLICSHCQTANREGMLFCEECGRDLRGIASSPTIPTRAIGTDVDSSSARATWGTAMFNRNTSVVLHVRGAKKPVELKDKPRLVFGRTDQSSEVIPDIDLTPYNAVAKGVSRQHAIIERSDDTLMLIDVGSSNGTYLNGQKLIANQPRVLRDGDEVRLGKLVTHIYFK
jgi:pSer/pThr/pTyr-binding forkhead associated (FHA) protein